MSSLRIQTRIQTTIELESKQSALEEWATLNRKLREMDPAMQDIHFKFLNIVVSDALWKQFKSQYETRDLIPDLLKWLNPLPQFAPNPAFQIYDSLEKFQEACYAQIKKSLQNEYERFRDQKLEEKNLEYDDEDEIPVAVEEVIRKDFNTKFRGIGKINAKKKIQLQTRTLDGIESLLALLSQKLSSDEYQQLQRRMMQSYAQHLELKLKLLVDKSESDIFAKAIYLRDRIKAAVEQMSSPIERAKVLVAQDPVKNLQGLLTIAKEQEEKARADAMLKRLAPLVPDQKHNVSQTLASEVRAHEEKKPDDIHLQKMVKLMEIVLQRYTWNERRIEEWFKGSALDCIATPIITFFVKPLRKSVLGTIESIKSDLAREGSAAEKLDNADLRIKRLGKVPANFAKMKPIIPPHEYSRHQLYLAFCFANREETSEAKFKMFVRQLSEITKITHLDANILEATEEVKKINSSKKYRPQLNVRGLQEDTSQH
ncbi:MAG: hypothetical protein ACYCQI_13860 [Gammaproteobacteria bacterium]